MGLPMSVVSGNGRTAPAVYAGMRFAVACGLLASSVTASSCVVSVDSQALVEREGKRFSVKGTPNLRLTTFDGAIEVRSWDRPEVLVEIEKRGPTREAVDALVVEVEQDGNKIAVEVKRPKSETFSGFAFHRSASAKLIVSVPQHTNVAARSGDGSIKIERVMGKLDLNTGDGTIRASEVDGVMTLHTGDGSVHVDNGQGQIDVNTGDGSVEVSGNLTAVKLHTGDGSIVFRADARVVMSDDWEISTGDGTVTLYLPPDFSAELDAHTNDGGIRNELHVASQAEADEGAGASRHERDENSRHAIRGRIGGGGKVLKIRTGDGSIRLRAS
jgi:Putative adhesin